MPAERHAVRIVEFDYNTLLTTIIETMMAALTAINLGFASIFKSGGIS